jgi:CheY-like chemotaxis protein
MAPTILVVDDEQAICDNLAAYLEDEGMQVYTAQSGEEALQHIAAGLRVQACVMDLRLPGMSGIEAILAIHRLAPAVHFVIHTGSADDIVAGALQRAGLGRVPVLRKPLVDMDGLAQALRSCSDVD